jgi:nucleoporin POM152
MFNSREKVICINEAPFWIEYDVLVSDLDGGSSFTQSIERKSDIQKTRTTFQFEPKTAGFYKYVFKRIGDRNYRDHGIAIETEPITQKFHPHSYAKFVSSQPSRFIKCVGDSVEMQVEVQGSGPWNLVYEVSSKDKTSRYTIPVDVNEKSARISMNDLKNGGRTYTIALVEITDANGCTNALTDAKDVVIEVLASRPSVSFQTSKQPIYILEGGRASLGLYLSGRGPFQLEYVNTAENERVMSAFINTGTSLEVGAGEYELLGFRDSVCTGTVGAVKKVNVVNVPKPTFSLNTAVKDAQVVDRRLILAPVCVGSPSAFQIDLTGKSPYSIRYKHDYTGDDGSPQSAARKIDVETPFLLQKIDTQRAGLHVYKLQSVADDNYKSPIALSANSPVIVEQIINPAPAAKFLDLKPKIIHCISKETGTFELEMKLVGQPPFNIGIEESHDNLHASSNKKEVGLDELVSFEDGYKYVLKTIPPHSMGKYQYSIETISDAAGCSSFYEKDSDASLTTTIEIADQAKISTINPPIVCVGDILSYNLQGTPPFTVGYSVNGKERPDIQVIDPILSLWAGISGSVTITKVCNAMQCCDSDVSSDPSMTTVIKPLPKVKVDGGEDIIDDIREGDQSKFSVEFEGGIV